MTHIRKLGEIILSYDSEITIFNIGISVVGFIKLIAIYNLDNAK